MADAFPGAEPIAPRFAGLLERRLTCDVRAGRVRAELPDPWQVWREPWLVRIALAHLAARWPGMIIVVVTEGGEPVFGYFPAAGGRDG